MSTLSLKYRVEGMDCGSCASKIETALGRLPSVSGVRVNSNTGSLVLQIADSATRPADVEQVVTRLGFKINVITPAATAPTTDASSKGAAINSQSNDHSNTASDHAGHGEHLMGIADGKTWWQTAKGQLVIASGVALTIAFILSYVAPSIGNWAYVIATLIGTVPVARRAFAAAQAGVFFTIEMLMTIAATGALFIGAAEEAAVVVFLFAVGELLEGVAAQSARAGIQKLGDLIPSEVVLEDGAGGTRLIATSELEVGDRIVVRPGDRVSADGTIVEGSSDIDEAPVTGESALRAKAVGADVFAGSINKTGALKITVSRPTADNTIARIIRMVEEAQEAKAPFERFIDQFARWYMPAIVSVAVLVAVLPPLVLGEPWYTWIYRALALLLIGCPCALVIATPAAIASSLSAGARRGLLMKGGAVIEAASKIKTVAFDKTGTLTEGRPVVTDIVGHERSDADVLALAASLETGSNHPIALAILNRAKSDSLAMLRALAVTAISGEGMSGAVDGRTLFLGAAKHAATRAPLPDALINRIKTLQSEGKTVSVLVENRQAIGLIAVRDEPRAGIAEAMSDLKALGVRTLMLTGDNGRTAKAIADKLGLEYAAELMPDDKLQRIRTEAASGNIAMVGDGINDAPALAAATVGIAMGGGTGVALETADAALVGDRISGVADLIRLSRRTMQVIWQNVAIALGLKAVFLITTVLGLTGLWIAIVADTGATVLVTLNALRLLGVPLKDRT